MMNIVPAPKYSIIFYDNVWVGEPGERKPIKSIQLLEEVAKILTVEVQDVIRALREWGLSDYPQDYYHKLDETGIDSRGKDIEYSLHVFNYQGGRENSKAEPYQFGILTKVRSWGKRHNSETTGVYFYLGAVA